MGIERKKIEEIVKDERKKFFLRSKNKKHRALNNLMRSMPMETTDEAITIQTQEGNNEREA